MKTRNLIITVLLVIGFLLASLSSVTGSAQNYLYDQHWKKADSTDNNPGGGTTPPIGH